MKRAIVVELRLTDGADEDAFYARLTDLVCDPSVALWVVDAPVGAPSVADGWSVDRPFVEAEAS